MGRGAAAGSLAAWTVAVALLIPPGVGYASEPGDASASEDGTTQAEPVEGGEATDAAPAPDDGVREQAQQLYDEGQVLYSAADYSGAIEKFTLALSLISRSDAGFDGEVRGRLLYNLATAHDRAYNINGEIKSLRQARELYARIGEEAGAHGYSQSLIDQAVEARARVDARMEQAEAESRSDEPTRPQPVVQPPAVDDGEESEPDGPPPGRVLTITGGVVAGVGVLASGLLVVGLVGSQRASDDVRATTSLSQEPDRVDAIDRGVRFNRIAVAGGVVSGVLVLGGVGMLIAGQVIAKRRGGTTACLPTAGPRMVGMGCAVRF